MSRKRARNLSPEERQLWSKVTETAKPLASSTSTTAPNLTVSTPEIVPTSPRRIVTPPVQKRTESLTGIDLAPDLKTSLKQQPLDMDAKLFRKMRSGKVSPEGRIDLHGMTLSQAHPRLIDFVQSAHQADKRLVLVITGKGKTRDSGGPIPVRTGVLRHQVPLWLRQFPVGPMVLQITPASQRHGGDGALYVYLRRRR